MYSTSSLSSRTFLKSSRIAIGVLPSPGGVQVLAGALRTDRLPVVDLVGGVVRLAVGGVRVGSQIVRLRQLMLEEDDIGVEGATLAEPDPRLGDLRAGIEMLPDQTTIEVVEQVLIDHQVPFDLPHLVGCETDLAARPLHLDEVLGDLGDVRVVGPEPLVCLLLRPLPGRRLVPGADRA
ncbi:MAG: hypothetical protein ACRDT2_17100, partial [Natronosporangium sp.]